MHLRQPHGPPPPPPSVPAHEGLRLLKQQLERASALLAAEALDEDDFRNWRATTSQVLAEALGEGHDLAASVLVAGPKRLRAGDADERREMQRARLKAQARALEPCVEYLEREALRQARRATAAAAVAEANPRRGARVCRKGHLVEVDDPAPQGRHCAACGSEVVDACSHCREPIRAKRRGVLITLGDDRVPAYCQGCGAPLPWTEARLEALAELLALSAAPEDERLALRGGAAALMVDSPETPVAVERWRRFLSGAGAPTARGFQDLLAEIAAESVKRVLLAS